MAFPPLLDIHWWKGQDSHGTHFYLERRRLRRKTHREIRTLDGYQVYGEIQHEKYMPKDR